MIKLVKPFGRYSGHVILSGELVGRKVKIIEDINCDICGFKKDKDISGQWCICNFKN